MKQLILISLVVASLLCGCTTNQQKIVYNTIYSVQAVGMASYDGFIDSVIAGKTPTDKVPPVSSAFNNFQNSVLVALNAVQFNTNALAPDSLVVQSRDLINLINSVQGN